MQIRERGRPGLLGLDAGADQGALVHAAAGTALRAATNPDSLFTTWRKWVDAYNPDVVVVRGARRDVRPADRRQVAEPRPGLLRRLRDEPLPRGGQRAGLHGRHRGADDVAVLRQRDLALGRRRGPRTRRAGSSSTTRPSAQVASTSTTAAGTTTDGKVYVFDLNQVVDPSGKYSPTIGPDQRALQRRGALLTLGRDLRRAAAAAGPAWRWGRPHATARRVARGRGLCHHRPRHGSRTCPASRAHRRRGAACRVRRATAADVDAMAAQLARTFWDDPVTSHIFRNEARRDAGLRAYFAHADAGRLPPVRRLLHDRGLRRLGHLGPGRQAAADRG